MPNTPWYRAGLKFECSQCGNCCTGAARLRLGSGGGIRALAAEKELGVEEFEALYVRNVGIRKSLKEFPNGDCVFFDNATRKCTVYNGRPRQCKTWPFWDSNLKTEADWQHTCEVCPGSGEGQLYNLGQIEEQRKVVKV